MANPFDQFDEPAAGGNPFDQFDAPPARISLNGRDPYWVQVNNALRGGATPGALADQIAGAAGVDPEEIARARALGVPDAEILSTLEGQFNAKFGAGLKSSQDLADAAAEDAWRKTPSHEKGMVALGAGANRLYRGVQQLAGAVDQNTIDNEAEANRALAKQDGTGVGMVAGEAIPAMMLTAPLAAKIASMSLPGRIAVGGGGVGAVAGALAPVETGESRLTNTVVGGATGIVAGTAGEALAAVVARAAPVVMRAVRAGQPVDVDGAARQAAQESGIDWDGLDTKARKAIVQAVRQSLDTADGGSVTLPDDVARVARAESLPVPVKLTKGLATRDLGQQIDEEQLRQLSPDLQRAYAARQEAIRRNIEAVGDGGETNPEAAGMSISTMVRDKLAATKSAVRDAYKAAEEQAGDTVVRPQAFAEWLYKNRHKPGVQPLINEAKDIGAIVENENGVLQAGKVALRDLYQVRSTASKLAADPSSAGKFAGEAKSQIDLIFDEAGGSAYAKAAALRRAQSMQFDERALPAAMTGKRGQEQVLADEKVMDRLLAMPVKQLHEFRKMAVQGNEATLSDVFKDRELRRQGVQALRDMRASTAQWLIGRSGGEQFSGARFVTAYRSLGGSQKDIRLADAKLRALMGGKAADELKRIYLVAKDATYDADALAKGSARHNTNLANRFLSLMKRSVGELPGAGPAAIGAYTTGSAVIKGGAAAEYGLDQMVRDQASKQFAKGAYGTGQFLGGFGRQQAEISE